MAFSKNTSRRIQVALGVAVVAGTVGHTARVLAGPTLSNLINLSNSAEMTVNNVMGQSFSASGVMTGGAIKPFLAATGALANLNPVKLLLIGSASTTVAAGVAGMGLNQLLGGAVGTFKGVAAQLTAVSFAGARLLRTAALSALAIRGINSSVSTIGAGIENTVFGVSNVKAGSAFTSQTTTSLTAF